MDVTNDDYIRLLSALLPPGPAWSASDPAIAGAAPSLTRVHQRADALMRELDPRTTTELINRWERLCGLPDECIPAGTQTLRQRQQRLDAKVNLAGGINEDFYLAQLAALGRPDATITRYDKSTFTCSSACTDAVNAPEWRYYWQVNIISPELHPTSHSAAIVTSHFFIVSPSSALDLFCPSLQIPARYSSH